MKIVEIELYDYYELSDEAKKKARENVMNSHDFRSYLECVMDADWRDIDMDFMDKCLYAYDHDKVAWRGIRDYLDAHTHPKYYYRGWKSSIAGVMQECYGDTWLEHDVIELLRDLWRRIASGEDISCNQVFFAAKELVERLIEEDVESDEQVTNYIDSQDRVWFDDDGNIIPSYVVSVMYHKSIEI